MPTVLAHTAVPLAIGLGLGTRLVSPRLIAVGILAAAAAGSLRTTRRCASGFILACCNADASSGAPGKPKTARANWRRPNVSWRRGTYW